MWRKVFLKWSTDFAEIKKQTTFPHTPLNVYISLCLIIIESLFYIFYFSQSMCLLPQRKKYGTFHFYKNTSLYEGSSACVHSVLILYYTYIFMVVLLPLKNQSDYLFHHYET